MKNAALAEPSLVDVIGDNENAASMSVRHGGAKASK